MTQTLSVCQLGQAVGGGRRPTWSAA